MAQSQWNPAWEPLVQERGNVPMPLEDSSEAAWMEYDWYRDRLEAQVAAGRRQGTWRGRSVRVAAMALPASSSQPVNTEEVMRIVRRNNRVCPVLRPWRELYRLLPLADLGERLVRPPLPLDSLSFPKTTDLNKQLVLRRQIEWAERFGVLATVASFLEALPEPQWHHVDAHAWPSLRQE